jgi:glucose dehydrogenase
MTITREPGSPMPPLKASAAEQRDLIAYLSGLDEAGPAAAGATGAMGAAGAIGAAGASPFEEILRPRPGDWATYNGRLDGNRYSDLAQITAGNVSTLAPKWLYTFRNFENETTPLVLDGIMYVTATNQVSALEPSGRELWRYSRAKTPGLRGDAAIGFNRGAAVLGGRVFIVTDNAHVLAISRANGALLWDSVMPKDTEQPYGSTMAPLVVGNLVVAGISGGDEGIRGFVVAYQADTGREAWRFWTVPLRGEPGSETWKGEVELEKGGGATWLTGSYDPETDTIYWPTGNPYPDTDGSERRRQSHQRGRGP